MEPKSSCFVVLFCVFIIKTGSIPVDCTPIVTTSAPAAADCGAQTLSQPEALYRDEIEPKLSSIAGNAMIVFNHSSLSDVMVRSNKYY